jgi:UDP-N-acetylmuramate dehydrogenase
MAQAREHLITVDHLASDLLAALGPDAVQANRPLAHHTLLCVGGPADLLVVAETAEILRRAVSLAWQHQVPCRVLGAGANVLVSDAGVRGLVVLNRARSISFLRCPDQEACGGGAVARAESGASFSVVARQCVQRGLAGLEWAASIPGTVGGAVVGNAGAWGGDVASTLLRATILEPSGVVADRPVEWFVYGYRTSLLKRRAPSGAPQAVVLEADFLVQPGDRRVLEARVAEMAARRKASQPPGASCGSVFKNPPGDYAGRLIEVAGLKGRRQGGAEISALHANFIVNHGTATAADVKTLIDLACQTVQARFGVTLELEIELVGDW